LLGKYKKILSEKSKQADINYKKAASIKNNAINNAKKELDKAYVEARRIKAQNKKDPIIDKDEPLDNSDYELSAADINGDGIVDILDIVLLVNTIVGD